MPNATATFADHTRLRERALRRLAPSGPTGGTRLTPHDALAVLHQLASSPATAADALTFLHELQVHQVELDMQQEELSQTRAELEQALARQAALFEHAPVAYFTLDARGLLCEVNTAGAQLLGMHHDELPGQPLAMFLSPAGVAPLLALLAQAHDWGTAAGCELPLRAAGGGTRRMQAVARADTVPGRVLLVLVDGPAAAEQGKA